jgi:hypothetical protein
MNRAQSVPVSVLKVIGYACGGIVLLGLMAVLTVWGCMKWQYHLPPPEQAALQFQQHRPDFIRLASLLRKNPSGIVPKDGGWVDVDKDPDCRALARAIGSKFVTVYTDGSMNFALWGFGGAIMSDSYLGVRYYPSDHRTDIRPGWTHTVVNSLRSDELPQEHRSVATGLYVVPIEPEWFIYRQEYQE